MIASSAAWSAAVAKLARPRFRVTIAVSPMAIASPTATAVSAARRASSAKRARSRELVLPSGIGWAEYPHALQEIVEVEWLGDHVLDFSLREVALELIRRRADEEHRHLADVGVGADPVVHLEAVESRHHDVEHEEVSVHLTDGFKHQRAVGYDDGLIAILVIDRIAQHRGDRFVVFADDDDPLFTVFGHIVHAAIYRRSCGLAKVR